MNVMSETAITEPEHSYADRLPAAIAILLAPGRTMRMLLDKGSARLTVPLFLLAFVSIALGDRSKMPFRVGVDAARSRGSIAIVVAMIIFAAAVFLALVFLFSWVAYLLGRMIFGGTGTPASVRSAIAWGMAPIVWALLYRIPMALFAPRPESSAINFAALGDHVLLAVVVLALDLTVLVTYVVASSFTIAAAHRITPGEALGTLLLTFATPVVIAVAAVLASHT
jgi:hypothetical protein